MYIYGIRRGKRRTLLGEDARLSALVFCRTDPSADGGKVIFFPDGMIRTDIVFLRDLTDEGFYIYLHGTSGDTGGGLALEASGCLLKRLILIVSGDNLIEIG
jgi:hypothetical protein